MPWTSRTCAHRREINARSEIWRRSATRIERSECEYVRDVSDVNESMPIDAMRHRTATCQSAARPHGDARGARARRATEELGSRPPYRRMSPRTGARTDCPRGRCGSVRRAVGSCWAHRCFHWSSPSVPLGSASQLYPFCLSTHYRLVTSDVRRGRPLTAQITVSRN